jgi:hypothetical protein
MTPAGAVRFCRWASEGEGLAQLGPLTPAWANVAMPL